MNRPKADAYPNDLQALRFSQSGNAGLPANISAFRCYPAPQPANLKAYKPIVCLFPLLPLLHVVLRRSERVGIPRINSQLLLTTHGVNRLALSWEISVGSKVCAWRARAGHGMSGCIAAAARGCILKYTSPCACVEVFFISLLSYSARSPISYVCSLPVTPPHD